MKRSAFQPKGYVPRPAKQIDGYTPRSRAVAVFDGKARMAVPVPKPEKAKPGKRPPTSEEREWMDRITAFGCIACYIDGHPGTPGAVHHLLRGGRRIGHLYSICLCDPGHHQNGHPDKISRHPWRVRFERQYGTESELLGLSRNLTSRDAA
jgi:hypothetical protein